MNAEAVTERRALVAKLSAQGVSLTECATMIGVCTRTVTRDRVVLGINKKPPPPLDEAAHQLATTLIAEGASLEEIARSVDRSTGWIRYHYNYTGWTPAETGRYNLLRKTRQAVWG